MADKDLVEDVARALQRQHGKEMLGEIQKWEKRPAGERSAWRSIARTVIDLVGKDAGGGPKDSGLEAAPAKPPKPRARAPQCKS